MCGENEIRYVVSPTLSTPFEIHGLMGAGEITISNEFNMLQYWLLNVGYPYSYREILEGVPVWTKTRSRSSLLGMRFSRRCQHLYHAMLVGKGTMAQFSHPEFGGTGQWMRGGMIMIGDMFNHALKARVEALCHDVAQRLLSDPSAMRSAAFPPFTMATAGWWPAELGQPAAVGGQNELSYPYFPDKHRLAIRHSDTIEHVRHGWVHDHELQPAAAIGSAGVVLQERAGLIR